MSLITLIVVLMVIGIILFLINQYVPMDGKIKQILNVAVVVLVILWLLISVLGPLPDIRVPTLR